MADDFTSTTSTTGSINPGGVAFGNIETVGDTDWFRITHIVRYLAVTTLTSSEHIVRTGDFNGDGIADILLHYDNGQTNILELNGHATGSQLLHTEAVHHDRQRLGNGEPSFRSHLVNLIDLARPSLAEIAWFVE